MHIGDEQWKASRWGKGLHSINKSGYTLDGEWERVVGCRQKSI